MKTSMTFRDYITEMNSGGKGLSALSHDLKVRLSHLMGLSGKIGFFVFLIVGAGVLFFGGEKRWESLALAFTAIAFFAVSVPTTASVAFGVKLLLTERSRVKALQGRLLGIDAPAWAYHMPNSDAREILKASLGESELEVADVLLKQDFQGTIGELIEVSKELS